MATGGFIEDPEVPDIYSCSVCLEHLLHRNPRFLSCHHYFCQKCLQKLTKRGQVSCPTCRRVTKVINNNVSKLTMNFPLVQVMEREQQLQQERERDKRNIFERERQIAGRICNLCSHEKTFFKCQECCQFLCEICKDKHNKMDTFKSHEIIKVCKDHLVGISHICLQCVKALCVKCIVLDHSKHEDKVQEYAEGVESLKESLEKMNKVLHNGKEALEICEKETDVKKHDVLKERKELQLKREDLTKQIAEVDNKLFEVTERERKLNYDFRLCKELKENCFIFCRNVEKLLQSSSDQILLSFLELKISMDKLTSKTGNLGINLKHDKHDENTEWLTSPVQEAVYDKLGQLQISHPLSIKAIDPYLYVYSDHSTQSFVVFDDKGGVKKVFESHKENGKVRCVDVYNNQRYLVQEKCIMHVADFNTKKEKTLFFKPKINKIHNLAVAEHNTLYCANSEEGKVYEYNTENDTTKTVLEGLKLPSYINVVPTSQGRRCILSLGSVWYGSRSVNIYNRYWQLLTTITQGISSPRDTAPCPGGFLLADRQTNKINLYSYTGELVRTVLTKQDGLTEPNSLTFKYPYLWIAQGYRGSGKILCFRIVK